MGCSDTGLGTGLIPDTGINRFQSLVSTETRVNTGGITGINQKAAIARALICPRAKLAVGN